MGGRGNTSTGGSSAGPKELYRRFIEGESAYIHEDATEAEKRELDKVFTPATEDMTTYKGMVVYEDQLDDISGINSSYSSTTTDKHIANVEYMSRAYDLMEDYEENGPGVIDKPVVPLMLTVNIKRGTPVANALGILGRGGMKEAEKEITVGRNAEWSYSNLRKVGDHYEATATVRKKQR